MKYYPALAFLCLMFSPNLLSGQVYQTIELEWQEPQKIKFTEKDSAYYPYFNGAVYAMPQPFLPKYFRQFELPASTTAHIIISGVQSEEIHASQLPKDFVPGPEYEIRAVAQPGRFSSLAEVEAIPFRLKNGRYERLVSFNISMNSEPVILENAFGQRRKRSNSQLATGDWFKVGVTQTGVHKLDYQMLKNMGFPVDNINPKNIQIFGHRGGMLPKRNDAPRTEGLEELAIFVPGEENNQFNPTDFILFYAEGPHLWEYDKHSSSYSHQVHYYSDTTYYFVTFSANNGKRITHQQSIDIFPDYTTSTYDLLLHHERDLWNSIHKNIRSGKEWYGEEFDFVTTQQINLAANGRDVSAPLVVTTRLGARSPVSSTFTLNANGQTLTTMQLPRAMVEDYLAPYIISSTIIDTFFVGGNQDLNLSVTYNKPSNTSRGFLNYISIQTRAHLAYNNRQILVRDKLSVGPGFHTRFNIGNGNSALIWDVTDFFNVKRQEVLGGGNFTLSTSELRSIAIFREADAYIPIAAGKIPNQDLRGLPQPDMIIVSHESVLPAAEKLANHHRSINNYMVHLVTPRQIYNEFSSGNQDVSAIRDFVRMFYENAISPQDAPKYLILFGDASYDYKNRIPNNTNLVPTFQGIHSISPIGSYGTDDFFGFLDPHEGDIDAEIGKPSSIFDLDIAIGRFPVHNLQQAHATVDKVLRYNTPSNHGNWRNNITFIADDGDVNEHFRQSEVITNKLADDYPILNIDKIYFDAYPKRSTPSGARYPDVKNEINRKVNTGTLLINYIGHGGELGWAHERVLEINDIHSWRNNNILPLFVTATCEFTRFDDPERISAGELVFLKPDGGGIGLLTTTRVVYSHPNFVLAQNLFNLIFEPVNGINPSVGNAFMRAKNASPLQINNLSFAMLGDPAMQLARPRYEVVTTEFNNNPVGSEPDTMKALSLVSIKGQIHGDGGQVLTSFNGIVYPTVYDKAVRLSLLGNDPGSKKADFEVYQNVLYKGKASVVNGQFSFQFIVPKDISYQIDHGKISYYASSAHADATGYYNNFVIGGTSDSIIVDNTGPEIELYINDDNFAFGGLTHENPLLIAKLKDESGINTAGNGIGHELTAVLNDGKPIVLNDYYEAALDNYKEGEINYPFYSLEDGRYTLKVKVWDVANNSSEAYTEFVVASSSEVALNHVLNYPNPFTTQTTFMFDHNRPGEMLDVKIQVFTIGGRLIKTLDHIGFTKGSHFADLSWNGLDEFGNNIGRGVYVYKLTVRTPAGDTAQKYEKLVILK